MTGEVPGAQVGVVSLAPVRALPWLWASLLLGLLVAQGCHLSTSVLYPQRHPQSHG